MKSLVCFRLAITTYCFTHFNNLLRYNFLTLFAPSSMSSILPNSSLSHSFIACIHGCAVLFTIFPLSFVLLASGPCKDTMPMFFIIFVLTYVNFSIWPCEGSVAMHAIVQPLSGEAAFVFPRIGPLSVNIIV